ncbi:alkaline phosphatase family protein [Hymenobacter koreensis]|uniref:Alkaline phosphatase family protein n=1 Tax=Hymenobacter koreensis TaxID=1084523 RepID=A0ABP8J6Q4_9BACT
MYWLLLFALSRAAFLVYHYGLTVTLSGGEVVRTFVYGARLDASAAAYLCFVPFALLIAGSTWRRLPVGKLVAAYTAVVGLLVALMSTADLELYRAWGFRLDSTPLQYLGSPGEMAASAGSAPLGVLGLVLLSLLLLGWVLYRWLLTPLPPLPPAFPLIRAVTAGLLYAVLLVVPLRGGVQQIPVNQSDVYFSAAHPFANHAAINVPWNVAQSMPLRELRENPYNYMPDSTAARMVSELYKVPAQIAADSAAGLVTTPKPNVLFIILESFTAKLVGHLGGKKGVTPTLDSLARVGVSFEHLYASGDRSQKGIVSLLSGYPTQPNTSIIKFPRKTAQLPSLAQSLGNAGYSTSFYYGGELAFANMKAYLLSSGYRHLVERQDFAQKEQNSKWGAHDHVLFRRVLQELRQQSKPFFATAFTLSSHEPFDVPGQNRSFDNQDEETFFRNSVAYTDHTLGQFLQAARREAWWPNTLVVLVADHGHQLPGWMPVYEPRKFHIPLLLTGGALNPAYAGRSVATFGSQTDVAATLLSSLRLPTTDYRWSRNLLGPAPAAAPGGFAFFCFTDGFGMMTPRGRTVFDNVSRDRLTTDPVLPTQQRQGQAYQQRSFADFLQK